MKPGSRVNEERIAILGNSGSGKSSLAARLAAERQLAHLDLDTLAWLPSAPPERVPLSAAREQILRFTEAHGRWVVEGCYADWVEIALPLATELLFLDLPVHQCQQNARRRPWEPHKYPTPAAQNANLPMLLQWIAQYPSRPGPLGRAEHERLFLASEGAKRRIAQ